MHEKSIFGGMDLIFFFIGHFYVHMINLTNIVIVEIVTLQKYVKNYNVFTYVPPFVVLHY